MFEWSTCLIRKINLTEIDFIHKERIGLQILGMYVSHQNGARWLEESAQKRRDLLARTNK